MAVSKLESEINKPSAQTIRLMCGEFGVREPWLREDCGDTLTYDVLAELIKKHPHITCLCFMGGDRYYQDMADLIKQGKQEFPKLK